MSDLSIVIVSWNAKTHLLKCLHSLRATCTGRSAEITVVDNASADGSPEAVRQDFPQVRLIENGQNEGFAKANNIGINVSQGKYIALINSDVQVRGGCLETLVQYMEANPGVGMSGPTILYPDLTVQNSVSYFPTLMHGFLDALGVHRMPKLKKSEEPRDGVDRDEDVEVLSGCFWMVRRAALDEVGLLDESFFMYGEDIDWCRRFHQNGWKIRYCKDAEAVHYHGASSSNDPLRFFIQLQKARIQYWQKHRGRSHALICTLLLFAHHSIRMIANLLLVPFVFGCRRKNVIFRLKKSSSFIFWLLSQVVQPLGKAS